MYGLSTLNRWLAVSVLVGLFTGLVGCDNEPTMSRGDASDTSDTPTAADQADDSRGDLVEDDDSSSGDAIAEDPGEIDAEDGVADDTEDSRPEPLPDVVETSCFTPGDAAWTTCGGWLFDAEGRRALLRGVNVANVRKQYPYEGGTTPEDFEAMSRLGFNHIRLLWSWAAAMPEPDVLDQTYLDRLADEIARAGEYGILVLVDSHQDLYGEAIAAEWGPVGNGAPVWACPEDIAGQFDDPASPWFLNYTDPAVMGCFDHLLGSPELQQSFATAWGAVAERVADLPNVVGYDLWNEPFWGTHNVNRWEEQSLLPLYERLAAAILEHDPDAVLFVEPGLQKNVLTWSHLPRPSAPHVVYAPHLYDPSMEGGEPWSGVMDYFTSRIAVDRTDTERWDDAPLYYGEWGGSSDYDNAPEYASAMADLYDAEQVGWAYWCWGPGSYSLTDADLTPTEVALRLARPYPERIAGDELQFGIDPETGVFEARWTARHIDVPTVIVVPELSPFAEAEVIVTGGTLSEATVEDRIEVLATTEGAVVEVRLEP